MAPNTSALFNAIYAFLRDIELVIAFGEIAIDSTEFLNHWKDEKYFDAGMFFGKNVAIISDTVSKVWDEHLQKYFYR